MDRARGCCIAFSMVTTLTLAACADGGATQPDAVIQKSESVSPGAESLPDVSPSPSLDPGQFVTGEQAMFEVTPTLRQMQEIFGGRWDKTNDAYSAPGEYEDEISGLDREIALLASPERCEQTAMAIILRVTWRPKLEVFYVNLRQGGATIHLEVIRFRSADEAQAELGQWQAGARECRSFDVDLNGREHVSLKLDELSTDVFSIRASVGRVDQPLHLETVGSAVVLVSALSSSVTSAHPTRLQLKELAHLMADNIRGSAETGTVTGLV